MSFLGIVQLFPKTNRPYSQVLDFARFALWHANCLLLMRVHRTHPPRGIPRTRQN
jgi:hypothetical protein